MYGGTHSQFILLYSSYYCMLWLCTKDIHCIMSFLGQYSYNGAFIGDLITYGCIIKINWSKKPSRETTWLCIRITNLYSQEESKHRNHSHTVHNSFRYEFGFVVQLSKNSICGDIQNRYTSVRGTFKYNNRYTIIIKLLVKINRWWIIVIPSIKLNIYKKNSLILNPDNENTNHLSKEKSHIGHIVKHRYDKKL